MKKRTSLTDAFAVLDNLNDGVIVADENARITFFSRQAERLLLRPAEEAVGSPLEEIVRFAPGFPSHAEIRRTVESSGLWEGDVQAMTAHDAPVWLAWSMSLFVWGPEGPDGFLAIARDISQRKLALGALAAAEERYRAVVETVPDSLLVHDREGRIHFVNRVRPGFTNLSTEQFLQRSLWEFGKGPVVEVYREAMERTLASGEMGQLEVTDIYGRVFEARLAPFREADDHERVLLVLRDITAARRAEELERRRVENIAVLGETAMRFVTLQPDENVFRLIAEQARRLVGDAIVAVSEYLAGKDCLVCRALVGLGAEEIEALTLLGGHPEGKEFPVGDQRIRAELASGVFVRLPGGLNELGLGEIPAATSVSLEDLAGIKEVCVVGLASHGWILGDIALMRREKTPLDAAVVEMFARQAAIVLQRRMAEMERAQLEKQLLQSQKMEAIGLLAGGIAHDFNNLITGIVGNLSLMMMDMDETDPSRETLTEVQAAAQRAADLTRQLLAFSRRQTLLPKPTNLNDVVGNLQRMLVRLIGEDVALAVDLWPEVELTMADPGQIEQVIVNLAVNARDAMPEGGRLTIATAPIDIDETFCQRHPPLIPGRHVTCTVRDTGCGMDAETMAHVFEPFFTTKPKGRGTGLGLSTAYGIIRQHQGAIDVQSRPGEGATFTVYLPVVSESLPRRDAAPASAASGPMQTGKETILVVEDDDIVRELNVRTLKRLGYRILSAADGPSALALVHRHSGVIQLLLTDVVMPEMNGRELAAELVKLRPDIRVLYTSGYADNVITRHGGLGEDVHFLHKPYTPGILAGAVRAALEAPVPSRVE
ncbi:MAG: PAS domain S-box protein [Myxococcales bacterium]|nr:MAG: PAS domain S-box protein [Myxococcales bacterium]